MVSELILDVPGHTRQEEKPGQKLTKGVRNKRGQWNHTNSLWGFVRIRRLGNMIVRTDHIRRDL